MRFGISTHLYHDRRLEREHLVQIASYGFEAVELFATRTHFDYHDGAAIAALAQWLSETGLRLNSIHAPITDHFGIRLDIRSYITFLENDSEIFCVSSGGATCLVKPKSDTFLQYGASLGFSVGF